MNATRRKKLNTAQDILEAVKEKLEELLEEEEEDRRGGLKKITFNLGRGTL